MVQKHPTTSSLTESDVGLPWQGRDGASPDALHFVVVWSLDEPERVGETTPVTAPCLIGRGPPDGDEAPRAAFARVRPGSVETRPPLQTKRVSRRQLLCEPRSENSVRV